VGVMEMVTTHHSFLEYASQLHNISQALQVLLVSLSYRFFSLLLVDDDIRVLFILKTKKSHACD
jgi:hypothetical protein